MIKSDNPMGNFGVTQEDLNGVLDTSKVPGDTVEIISDMVNALYPQGLMGVESWDIFATKQLDSIFKLLMAGY